MNPNEAQKPGNGRSGGRRPRKGSGSKPVSSGPVKPGAAARTDSSPGPRPMSSRQQELRALMRGETASTPAESQQTGGEGASAPRLVSFRDASTTRSSRNARPSRERGRGVAGGGQSGVRANRRRPNYAAIGWSLTGATLLLVGLGMLFTHPRLTIRTILVEGNQAISTAAIEARIHSVKGRNLLLAPLGQLEKTLLKEPIFKQVTVEREWADRLRVVVSERQPWASVLLPDGSCYTIDEDLVPFRRTETPEKGLPRVLLSQQKEEPDAVKLGQAMRAPGLKEVSQCLAWAGGHPDFALEAVAIDPTGKLCLNRKGGVQVRLGSVRDLTRKLETLDLLLARRPELKTGAGIAYINLYAYDAPAVMPRSLSPNRNSRGLSRPPSASTRPRT